MSANFQAKDPQGAILNFCTTSSFELARVFNAVKRELRSSKLTICRRLTSKTAKKHPKEFAQARQRYPSPDYDQ